MDLPGMSPHSREEFGVAHDERRRIQRSLDVGQPDRDAALGFFNEIPSVIENSSHFAGGQGRTGGVIDFRWIRETIADRALSFGREEGRTDGSTAADVRPDIADEKGGPLIILQAPQPPQKSLALFNPLCVDGYHFSVRTFPLLPSWR